MLALACKTWLTWPFKALDNLSILFRSFKGRLWYSGSTLDCWSTGQVTNPAPGA